MNFLALGGPESLPAGDPAGLGFGSVAFAAAAAFVLLLIAVAAACWHYVSEFRAWRGSKGRSVFWPLLR